MKIVVAATRHPHALSRREVERLLAALQSGFAAAMDEFVLSTFDRWPAAFTDLQLAGKRRVEFCMVVKDKTSETTEVALREFLLGLSRMEAGSKFDRPVSDQERREHACFIERWLPVARAAIAAQVVKRGAPADNRAKDGAGSAGAFIGCACS